MFEVESLRSGGRPPVSFRLQAGERVCLWGPSGCGKTRLLRALVDLDPSEGAVSLKGTRREQVPAALWRRRVALLPAESRWWAATVGEHFADPGAVPFARLGLDPQAADWSVERLSSGERQRLALLRVLAGRPEVLLLDEPTANLDAASSERVEALIGQYLADSGAACLWVSHDREQRRRLCARSLAMNAEGELAA